MFQHGLVGLEHGRLNLGFLVAGGSGFLLLAQARLDGLQVLELQFGIYDFLVAHGVDGPIHMGDVLILEAAQHVDDGIRLTDVAEELVAETLALARTFHESGDVYYLAGGGNDASGMHQLGQFGESLVGNGDHAHVGFNRTEGEVGCLCLGTRQTVEEGGFTHVGQSDNSTF